MQDVYTLTKEYYEKRDELKELRADIADLEERVNVRATRVASLNDKCKQLATREWVDYKFVTGWNSGLLGGTLYIIFVSLLK